MKTIKKIVGASCALVMAVAISTGASFAWVGAARTEVNVTGMNVNIDVPEGIAISDSYAGLSSKAGSVSLTLPTHKLQAAMYCGTDTGETYKTNASANVEQTAGNLRVHGNLLYLKNPENIDTSTGRAKVEGGESLPLYYDLANGGTESGPLHYLETGVYIAATSANPIESKNIKATLINNTSGTTADIYKALTVDFYTAKVTTDVSTTACEAPYADVKTVSNTGAGQIGCSSTKSVRSATTNLLSAGTPVVVYDGSVNTNTIPVQGSGAVVVWMRIYFDGTLPISSGGDLLVSSTNAESVTTTGVDFSVKLEIVGI